MFFLISLIIFNLFSFSLLFNLTFNRFPFSSFHSLFSSLFLHYFCLFSLFQLFNLFQDNFFYLSLFLFQYYTTLPPSSLLNVFLFVLSFFSFFFFHFLQSGYIPLSIFSLSLSLTLVPPLCPFTHLSPFFRIEQIKRIDRACAERSKTVPWPAARMIYSGANHPPEISDTPNEFLGWCAYVCKDGRGLKEIWGEPTTPSTTRVLTEISTSQMLIERYLSPNILSC